MKRRNVILGVFILLVVIIGGAAALIITRLQSDQIPLGAPSGELAFISDRSSNWDIYIVDPQGDIRNLTGGDDAQDYMPSFAFDSEMLNFLTTRDNDAVTAGQVTPDGDELETLSVASAILAVFRAGRFDWDPSWVPGSDRIVFASVRDLNLELYISDSDGENRQRLTNDGGRDWFPTVSPDGTQILFASDREDSTETIFRMDIDGQNLMQLTDTDWDNLHPTWALDGERILFIRDEDDGLLQGNITLYVMNIDGSDMRPLQDGEVFEGDAMYSANNGQVAYMSNEEGNWHIYVMDVDGSNVRRVTDGDSNNMFPVWRPNPLGQE